MYIAPFFSFEILYVELIDQLNSVRIVSRELHFSYNGKGEVLMQENGG